MRRVSPTRNHAARHAARLAVVAVLTGLSSVLFAMAGVVVAWEYMPFPTGWLVGSAVGALLPVALGVCVYGLGRGDGYGAGWRAGWDRRDREPAPGYEATAADVEAMWEQVAQALDELGRSVAEVSAVADDVLEVPTVASQSRLVRAGAGTRRPAEGGGAALAA